MIDDLREQAALDFDLTEKSQAEGSQTLEGVGQEHGRRILGMNAAQRFFLALLLFLMIFTASAGCLLLTGRIYL